MIYAVSKFGAALSGALNLMPDKEGGQLCKAQNTSSDEQGPTPALQHSSWLVRGEGTDVTTLLQESPQKLPLAREARQLLYILVFLSGRKLLFLSLLNLYKISVAHSCFKRNL